MLVGIVSDSHDNVPMLRRAVEHFSAAGCELVLHAGDVIAPFAMAVMDGLSCPFKAIYGNNDGEKVGLKLKAVAVGGSIQEPPLVVEKDKNGSRVGINPGECGGWLTGSHTAALLDTGTLEVRIIDLSLDPGKEIPE